MTTKTVGDAIRTVAVMAYAKYADEQSRLAGVAAHAVVRFFPPGQREGCPGVVAVPIVRIMLRAQ